MWVLSKEIHQEGNMNKYLYTFLWWRHEALHLLYKVIQGLRQPHNTTINLHEDNKYFKRGASPNSI